MYDPITNILDRVQSIFFDKIVRLGYYPDINRLRLDYTDDESYNQAFDAEYNRIVTEKKYPIKVTVPESFYDTTSVEYSKIAITTGEFSPAKWRLCNNKQYRKYVLQPDQDTDTNPFNKIEKPTVFYAEIQQPKQAYDILIKVRTLAKLSHSGLLLQIVNMITEDGYISVKHNKQDIFKEKEEEVLYSVLNGGSITLAQSINAHERLHQIIVKNVYLSDVQITNYKVAPIKEIISTTHPISKR